MHGSPITKKWHEARHGKGPEPEKEDPTDEILKMLGNLLEGQSTIMRALQLILNDQMNEKTASCGNS